MNCVEVNIDITIVQGGTFSKQIIWETGDPPSPVNLTGYSAKMTVRKKIADETAILSLESKSGSLSNDSDSGIYFHSDASDGTYTIYIKDDDTKVLCPDHKNIPAVYDLFLTTPDGETVLRQYGSCTIKAAITRI
jgi:hypothetical protein